MCNYWAWRLILTCREIPLTLSISMSFYSNWATQPWPLPASLTAAVIYLLSRLHSMLPTILTFLDVLSHLKFILFTFAWIAHPSVSCIHSFSAVFSDHAAIWHCPGIYKSPLGKPSRLQIKCRTPNIRVHFEAVLHIEPFKRQQGKWTEQLSSSRGMTKMPGNRKVKKKPTKLRKPWAKLSANIVETGGAQNLSEDCYRRPVSVRKRMVPERELWRGTVMVDLVLCWLRRLSLILYDFKSLHQTVKVCSCFLSFSIACCYPPTSSSSIDFTVRQKWNMEYLIVSHVK